MTMIRTIFGLTTLLASGHVFAMGNPLYVALNNSVEFGKYIEANMDEIVNTSATLAEAAIPNSHYFLITESITLNTFSDKVDQGKTPFATLFMRDGGGLECSRDIYSNVTTNEWGENRKMNFSLAKAIRCQVKP